MNLNAYDNVVEAIDKHKTWINIKQKLLLSRELVYRKYYVLSKRYNTSSKEYDYFIILLDDYPLDRVYSLTRKDNYGRVKISVATLFKESSLNELQRDCNIEVTHVDHADDGDIYKLEI